MRVVLDANVVFAAVGWRGEAHQCLLAMAKRRITDFATPEILEEVRTLTAERESKFKHAPHTLLTWYYDGVKLSARDAARTADQTDTDALTFITRATRPHGSPHPLIPAEVPMHYFCSISQARAA